MSTFIEKLRSAIKGKYIPPIFSSADLKEAKIEDLNNNLSNYDKKIVDHKIPIKQY